MGKQRITEGEITSLVRRFFRKNGFRFLSTQVNGEKLYYTVAGNTSNNKQPDSIVTKEDLIVICEDKILFTSLFSEQNHTINDFEKLNRFLSSTVDLNLFKKKLPNHLTLDSVKIVGCLSSLSAKEGKIIDFISDILMHVSFKILENGHCCATLHCQENLMKYFTCQTIEFII